MADKSNGEKLLENAYQLGTAEDNVNYYQKLARYYDSDFATGLGYCYPAAIAEHFFRHATDASLPVADIGCGTGLVAEALKLDAALIDGFDISPDMLSLARQKDIYNALHEVDLTGEHEFQQQYGAVVSAGTFTFGHLGPDALSALLTISKPRGLFVIGVNQQHYKSAGFEAVMSGLLAGNRINNYLVEEVPIYTDTKHAHGSDTALVLVYNKA